MKFLMPYNIILNVSVVRTDVYIIFRFKEKDMLDIKQKNRKFRQYLSIQNYGINFRNRDIIKDPISE